MQVTIQGTVKELAAHGLRVNGKPVTQQMISVLVRLGACEEVGVEEKEPGQKGPAAKVYRFGGQKTFTFSVDNKRKPSAPMEDAQKTEPQKDAPTEDVKSSVETMPPLPEAFKSMTAEDMQAAIKALQGLSDLMTLQKH